jgi:hypothetical protein
MRKHFANAPKPILIELLLTLLIGVGCFAVGVAYYAAAKDKITLIISGLLLLFSVLRAFTLYTAVINNKYDVVEGTCVGTIVKPLRKQREVRVMADDGTETTIRLGKQTRVKIGVKYRFYFTCRDSAPIGGEYIDAALSPDRFLGYEEIVGDNAEKQSDNN